MTARQQVPAEYPASAVRVDVTVGAVLVPKSAAVEHCTVALVVAAGPDVVVAVVRGEHHSVVVAERVAAGVTRVPGHLKPVIVLLAHHAKCAVLGVVPASAATLQVKSQLVAAFFRQLIEQVVAEPVVAARIVESDFKLRPRTVEEVGPVDVLLDQQRNAVICRKAVRQTVNRPITLNKYVTKC